jgi:hypothetical protein
VHLRCRQTGADPARAPPWLGFCAAIRPLARRNAVGLRPERFSADCQGLVMALKEQLSAAEQERTRTTVSSLPQPGLAGLSIRALAAAAGITPRTLHRLEKGGVIHVSEKKRHGCVQRVVWERVTDAIEAVGVELLSQGTSFGAGVRWKAPRQRR